MDPMEWGYAGQSKDVDDIRERAKQVKNAIHLQGKLAVFKRPSPYADGKRPSPRGQIKLFSAASRFRLLKEIARIDWSKLTEGCFLTLTYPDECAKVDVPTATMQRHHFIRYMENYLCEKIPMLWRKEQQVRKSGEYTGLLVQHLHLAVFTGKGICCWQMNDWWRRCIGWKWEIQCHKRKLNSAEHAAFYLAKYMSKPECSLILDYASYLTKPGRAWGWHRKNLIPRKPADSFVGVTEEQWQTIMEQVLAISDRAAMAGGESFTLLGPQAEAAAKVVYEILS